MNVAASVEVFLQEVLDRLENETPHDDSVGLWTMGFRTGVHYAIDRVRAAFDDASLEEAG